MSRILLVEDDAALADGLIYTLTREAFDVTAARTLCAARDALSAAGGIDLILLDVTLPDGTGLDLCAEVRAAGNDVPILFLTAMDEEVSIIRGLDGGGDDYMTKPFKLGELCSRIRALLRRSAARTRQAMRLKAGALTLDLATGQAALDGAPLELTGMEYRLLCLLLRHAGQTLARGAILDALWDGHGDFVDDNTLSVYIRRLREKLEEDPSSPRLLMTVRGLGYCLKKGEEGL